MALIAHLVSLSAFILIHLSLIKVGAEDPTVVFTVEEGISAGLEVGSLGDDDVLPLGLDPGVRVALKYSLLPRGYPRSSLFRVAEDSGQVFTREKLDRESLCGYDPVCDLDIQVAVQSAISQFFKKVKVTIRVTDINDNEPTFPRQSISLSMLENVAVGTAFPLEEAEDLDLGINGVQVYEFLPSNDGSEDFFTVNLTKSDVGRNVADASGGVPNPPPVLDNPCSTERIQECHSSFRLSSWPSEATERGQNAGRIPPENDGPTEQQMGLAQTKGHRKSMSPHLPGFILPPPRSGRVVIRDLNLFNSDASLT
ncbi:hypothetical protein RRG08_024714 [Elysia crispata]|uniref:Cadherin domain-containing protein n=1 Tax=Elysia crispata TaxID=231223 RepID=A0AAE1CWX7_9GAST|nr:hypothetical protein RRG08_024714 [Elysia crispata]